MSFEIENIYSWDIEQLWNWLDSADLQKEYPEEYEKVKEGIRIKVPIYWIINDWWKQETHIKKASVDGFGKWELNQFMDEIQERCKIIRQIIINEEGKEDVQIR